MKDTIVDFDQFKRLPYVEIEREAWLNQRLEEGEHKWKHWLKQWLICFKETKLEKR